MAFIHNVLRMSSTVAESPLTDFEIDHPDRFSQYLLSDPLEISFYLNLLVKRAKLITAHIDNGSIFFLTTLIAVNDEASIVLLDLAQDETINKAAVTAKQLVLTANLNQIKMQFRLAGLREESLDGRRVLSAHAPTTLLRLQRREYFRLAPPAAQPISCQIHLERVDSPVTTVECGVADISCGGISLIAPTAYLDDCQPDVLFRNSRLDIPSEGVVSVNLRVRKTVEYSAEGRQHHLRVGCEFVGLPINRLAVIERYITRIERQRTAKNSGLAD